jgi:predicted phosphoadenosine phosphosulfate sulfurtransferase
MKFYLKQNVFDAALDRIRWLFDEFPNVIVNISGGKDSTVVMNLALKVAEEKNRLPLGVMFIDQEAEWQAVIDYVRAVMADSRIKPYWLQIPIKIFNATSTTEPWLYCWEEGKEWIREKEPDSIHVNKYGTDRFKTLFGKFMEVEFSHQKACHLGGVRCDESPSRWIGLTGAATYGDATWGSVDSKTQQHFAFYPIYDWGLGDVWKAIHDNSWSYCPIYDYMYQCGVPIKNMRVSNLHHETAVVNLYRLQEIEFETWNKVCNRISGINTAGILQDVGIRCPSNLPFMFGNWWEYRDYLLENLITDKKQKEKLKHDFEKYDQKYTEPAQNDLVVTEINCILTNDYHGTQLGNFATCHVPYDKNRIKAAMNG